MKKYVFLLAVLSLLVNLIGCAQSEVPAYFGENEAAFIQVKDFALAYYEDNADSAVENYVVIHFTEEGPVCLAEGAAAIGASDALTDAAKAVKESGFGYLWATDDHVVFWKDETKYSGLIWAQSPRKVIRQLSRKMYSFDKVKITDEWYAIGMFAG